MVFGSLDLVIAHYGLKWVKHKLWFGYFPMTLPPHGELLPGEMVCGWTTFLFREAERSVSALAPPHPVFAAHAALKRQGKNCKGHQQGSDDPCEVPWHVWCSVIPCPHDTVVHPGTSHLTKRTGCDVQVELKSQLRTCMCNMKDADVDVIWTLLDKYMKLTEPAFNGWRSKFPV